MNEDKPDAKGGAMLPKAKLSDLLKEAGIRAYSKSEVAIIKYDMESAIRSRRNFLCFVFGVMVAVLLATWKLVSDERLEPVYLDTCIIVFSCMLAMVGFLAFTMPRFLLMWGKLSWNRFAYIHVRKQIIRRGVAVLVRCNRRVEAFKDFLDDTLPHVWLECEQLVSTTLPKEYHQIGATFLWISCGGEELAVDPAKLPLMTKKPKKG